MDLSNFGALDYSIFGGMLAFSAAIGAYFAFFAKEKQNNTSEYLMGGKNVGIFPMTMSLIASNISGISLMGFPSEMYTYGTQLWIGIVADFIANTCGAILILPVLYELDVTSTYEYLERRYDQRLRKLGSALFLLQNFLYMPIVIYVPALAFAQVSGMSLSILIPLVCVVCIFYTSFGGLKAVVWTDAFMTVMILIGVVVVSVVGTIAVGGIDAVWERNMESGRIEFFNMSWDPRIRHTFWAIIIGKSIGNLSVVSINQAFIQRYMAMPTIRKARVCMAIQTLSVGMLQSFCCYTGLVIYAAYHNCDPISAGIVRKPDQLVPYFVMQTTHKIPALPGLFMAGVFSASLSTISTCLNSMVGVILEDFIRPAVKNQISESRAALYMKIAVIVLGTITTILAMIVDRLGGIIQISASLGSITMGPMLGIFLLGMFFPWVTAIGALWGGIAGASLVGWICIGAQVAITRHEVVFPWKNVTTSGCENSTVHQLTSNYIPTPLESIDSIASPFPLFSISYVYYTLIGTVTCVISGIIISWMTGFNNPQEIDPNLLCPKVRRFFKYSKRKDLINGVKQEDTKLCDD